jgi:hypothetical protein
MAHTSIDRATLDSLLAQNKLADALALLCHGARGAGEREAGLYTLLIKIRLHGPEYYEQRIDALRALAGLTDHEKTLIRRIFLYAFQVAEQAGQEDKRWIYQRLLRRSLLGQPLDQPIPFGARKAPARRIIELNEADIIPARVKNEIKENRGVAEWGGRRSKACRLALEFCALGLLIVPLPYLAGRIAPAPGYLIGPTATQATRTAFSESENLGTKTKAQNRVRTEFDEAQISEKLAKQLSGLRRAYARWNADNNTGGSVSLKLTVDDNGKVVAVDVFDSQFSESGFLQLVVAEARKWRFPAGRAETGDIIVPLLFVPKTLGASQRLAPQDNFKREPAAATGKPDSFSITERIGAAGFSAAAIVPTSETIDGNNANSVESLKQGKLDYIVQRTIMIREAPHFASPAIEEVGGGNRIVVVDTVGDWLKVQTDHSRVVGFVRKEFIAPAAFAP